MHFTIARDTILKPLSLACSVIDKKQHCDILQNIFFAADANSLTITGSDSEIEYKTIIELNNIIDPGSVTLPGRRIYDWIKQLPVNSFIEFRSTENDRVTLKAGSSLSRTTSLPAQSYPFFLFTASEFVYRIKSSIFKESLDKISFSMADQDVRYFLNGLLFDLRPEFLRLVATDGHRLSLIQLEHSKDFDFSISSSAIILPRKTVFELSRTLSEIDGDVDISLSNSSISFKSGSTILCSRLIDGKFPDYERVLPKSSSFTAIVSKDELKFALSRLSVFTNEKSKGVRFFLSENILKLIAANNFNDEATEILDVTYSGHDIESAFNLAYLLDLLAVIDDTAVKLSFADPQSSLLIQPIDCNQAAYIVMPMRI